ncbi:MAG: phosphoribosylamine--glycine ligase, partial [Proteobacteria bacterium]|nr:phosphoribosylamine--glycine ligase [Pseudomonadota bacterium]
MKVLIIGGGGREHALAWKAAQSPRVEKVFVAPGNAGTAREAGVENVAIDPMDFDALTAFVREHGIEQTIVGPEAPLVAGAIDAFRGAGLRCFGPTAAAAQLEGSKSYAKDFLARHRIPTAEYRTFTEVTPAIEYINAKGAPIVVKADGLAAGKGVVVAETLESAHAAVRDMLEGNAFGEAGARVVVEEFLVGEEASFICMVDGGNILPMATSQDHKARDEGDKGPNTGGMGAYSPAPVVTDTVYRFSSMITCLPAAVRYLMSQRAFFSSSESFAVILSKSFVTRSSMSTFVAARSQEGSINQMCSKRCCCSTFSFSSAS